MSKKIRIGLVSRTLTLRDEVPTYQKAPYVPRDIVTILGELSALPIVFPDVEGASGKDYVDLADALFLPGGQDVDPTFLEKNRRGKWAVRITRWTALNSISFGPFMRQENPFLAFAAASRSSILPLAVRFIKIFRLTAPVLTSATAKKPTGPIPSTM